MRWAERAARGSIDAAMPAGGADSYRPIPQPMAHPSSPVADRGLPHRRSRVAPDLDPRGHGRGQIGKAPVARVACPNNEREQHGRLGAGNVVLHGGSKVKGGRRSRYRCTACGKMFGARTSMPCQRLHHAIARFDRAAALSVEGVEGVNTTAIARLEGVSWNTISRWLERAAARARRLEAEHLRGHPLVELQLDEMNAFPRGLKRQAWIFASIDVWSRPWRATLAGLRTYRNTRRFVPSSADPRHGGGRSLMTDDGFKFYAPITAGSTASGACSRR